jgi:hypothetical protein
MHIQRRKATNFLNHAGPNSIRFTADRYLGAALAFENTLIKLFGATYLLQLRHTFSSNPYSILRRAVYLLQLRQTLRVTPPIQVFTMPAEFAFPYWPRLSEFTMAHHIDIAPLYRRLAWHRDQQTQ